MIRISEYFWIAHLMVCFPVPWFWWSHCFEDWWAIPQPLGHALRRPGLYGKPSGSVLRNVLACSIKYSNCRFNKDQGASFFLREEYFWLQETFLPKHPVRKRVEEKSFVFKFCFYLFPSFATSFSSVGFHLGKKLFHCKCLVGFKLIAYWFIKISERTAIWRVEKKNF